MRKAVGLGIQDFEHAMEVPATDTDLIFRLKELAEKEIRYVFAGNC